MHIGTLLTNWTKCCPSAMFFMMCYLKENTFLSFDLHIGCYWICFFFQRISKTSYRVKIAELFKNYSLINNSKNNGP